MRYHNWLKCINKLDSSIHSKSCPNCGELSLRFQFVGGKESGVGSLYFWCESCKQGIQISRVNLPEGADILSLDSSQEEFRKKIPEYKVIND